MASISHTIHQIDVDVLCVHTKKLVLMENLIVAPKHTTGDQSVRLIYVWESVLSYFIPEPITEIISTKALPHKAIILTL